MKLVLLTASVRSFSTSNPSSRTEPDVGSVSPSSIWMVVVLPAPLGPSRAHTWPRGTAKVSPSTAATVPKDFLSSVTSMAGERTRHLLDADNGNRSRRSGWCPWAGARPPAESAVADTHADACHGPERSPTCHRPPAADRAAFGGAASPTLMCEPRSHPSVTPHP